MTKSEFIQACTHGGYCTKTTAMKYAEGKSEFSDSDIEEAFRMEQEEKSQSEARRRYQPIRGSYRRNYMDKAIGEIAKACEKKEKEHK